MISLVDYGVANLGSMRNMLRRIGAETDLVTSAAGIEKASKIILPGIGAFDHGMQALDSLGLVEPLRRRVLRDGVPLFGVCLGVQLLGERSAEGERAGLGLLASHCERLPADGDAGIRIPHMSWAHIEPTRTDPILDGLDETARFYFVHSYHVVCSDPTDVLAVARYGIPFTAMIRRGNIYGAQFHPEKSHRFGMQLLKNFVEL
jgi:glutamine amidotransferase